MRGVRLAACRIAVGLMFKDGQRRLQRRCVGRVLGWKEVVLLQQLMRAGLEG